MSKRNSAKLAEFELFPTISSDVCVVVSLLVLVNSSERYDTSTLPNDPNQLLSKSIRLLSSHP